MNAPGKLAAGLSCLLPLLIAGAAQAAALFDPEYTDSSTFTTQPIGTIGSPVASGYLLDGTQKVFVVDYSSVKWTGDLHSYNLSNLGVVSRIDNWEGGAKGLLQVKNAGDGDARYIVTNNGNTGIPFRWANLSSTQKTALDSASSALVASPVLDYLRGSNVNETPNGNSYRARTYVLGDIIHSTPRYWKDADNNTTVFVGANDGMMHAFDAVTGQERFAYIPSVLISKLPNLKNIAYYHKYFVDGQFAARNFGSQSILVGTLGAGGKGLYGLDITAIPTSEVSAASKVLWEITNTTVNYTNLGHTFGTPRMTVLPNGNNALIVGNGYNNTGNGHAVLYIINPATGARLAEIDTGSGTTASPNGLSSPTLVDSNFDGKADFAYAGDIDGNLWKFDLNALSATLLHTTSPAQAITIAPGFKEHPLGGYMITFATGRLFTTADETSNATHYAYGIWDRPAAYSTNDTLLDQVMTERTYTGVTPNVRVRTATNNAPNWTAGAGHHKGWRTALPIAGERVVGDGPYVPDSVFLFMSVNPLINPTHFPPFENWWMQINALTGGDNNLVRFDLNGDNLFTAADTVSVSGTPTSPVARFMGGGVRSQLTEFSTPSYEIFLANYDVNGDPPVVTINTNGVAGGHFDYDIYFGKVTSAGTQASLTIVVGTNGQQTGVPAALGTMTLDGVTVVPALSTSDLPDGTNTTVNATTIKGKVGGGLTATLSGSTITIKAPIGADYNGKTLVVNPGPAATVVYSTPTAPSNGALVITDVASNHTDGSIKCGTDYVTGAPGDLPTLNSNNRALRLDDWFTKINGKAVNGYVTNCSKTVTAGATSALNCTIAAPVGVSACSSKFTLKQVTAATTNTGPVGGTDPTYQSGNTDFSPALTVGSFSGGADAVVSANDCPTGCSGHKHVHEYDDIYDRTGVNMLDPTLPDFDIASAIPSKNTAFKVLVQNQYLNPAAKLHLHGTPAYQYNIDAGYVPVKNYQTSFNYGSPTLNNLDISQVPSYTRANVGSLTVNLPIDAFAIRDWWGGVNGLPPDNRVGLMPTQTGCVTSAAGTTDGSMYEPVIPFGAGDGYSPAVTVPTYGLLGYGNATPWSPGVATTAATARGARHNGALVIQVIKDTTPQSAIEPTIPGHPEYGFRVMSALYSTYVLVEYTTFWHHPNGKCFGVSGWVKDPPPDTSAPNASSAGNLALAAAHGDPKIGSLGSGGTGVVAGTTTTTVTNPDGTTTTTTVTITINGDGSATTTTTVTNSSGTTTTTGTNTNYTGGVVDSAGIIGGGVTTPADAVGRVNWRELLR